MFSIYLVLGIGCLHTEFNQSKGPEGEVGAGSQIKELKQTLLFPRLALRARVALRAKYRVRPLDS